MLTDAQADALRGYVDALADVACSTDVPYGRMRKAVGGWRAVARLLLDQHDEIARLRAELEHREQEYQRLYTQRDRIHAMHIDARAEVERLRSVLSSAAFELSCYRNGPSALTILRDALAREDGEG